MDVLMKKKICYVVVKNITRNEPKLHLEPQLEFNRENCSTFSLYVK